MLRHNSIVGFSKLMSQVITVHDMAATGVKLLRYGDPSFALALSPKRSTSIESLLPYTVVISNETDQGILAYSIRWKLIDPEGKVSIQESTIFDQATLRVLAPHSRQLATFAPGLASWSHNEPETQAEEAHKIDRLLSTYRKQQAVDISLEAVIFSDGRTFGNDTGFWVPRIKAWIDAERDIMQQVQTAPAHDLEKTLTQIRDEGVAELTTPELISASLQAC